MEELLALRPVSVWASQAMLCESVCGVSSAVFLVHYFFMLALTLMLREWKRRYACVLSSLSALCHLMGVFGIMYKIFFMFWSVFAYLQECISTHTHTHTHTGDLQLETLRIKLWFYYTVLLEGQTGIILLHTYECVWPEQKISWSLLCGCLAGRCFLPVLWAATHNVMPWSEDF